MINQPSNKIIILSLAFFILVSFFFLAFIQQRQQNSADQDAWWVLYFTDIRSDNLNFAIENHAVAADFHWELFQNKDKMQAGDIKIEQGAVWTSNIQATDLTGTIIIKVSTGKDKKEIYKIITH